MIDLAYTNGNSQRQQIHSNLPHFSKIGCFQFITFRTFDSVDDFIRRIHRSKLSDSEKQYKIDKYSDSSNKGAYLNGNIIDFLKDFINQKEDILFKIICFCIMPNHLHLLLQQLKELDKIMHDLKGGSAYKINQILSRRGKFWEEDYYDRFIRNEIHFDNAYNYIMSNPYKANLKDAEKRCFTIFDNNHFV
jgi:REP element-mobilizing transposase RayT